MSIEIENYTEFALTEEDLKRLRDTRLHFWIELVAARARQKLNQTFPALQKELDEAGHKKCERIANEALKHIQNLNIFFDTPNFDTAENDYQKLISGEQL